MKPNKLLLILLGISITFHLVPLFFNANNASQLSTNRVDDNLNQAFNNPNNDIIFGLLPNSNKSNASDGEQQIKILKSKIAILVIQNTLFQKQLDAASQKQQGIINALNSIVDKIDNQLLTPATAITDFQASSYNLNFKTISRDVVKQCMKVTTEAASEVRHQQRQTREQLLQEEETDDVWTSEVESKLQTVLSDSQLSDSELVSLNCRTTICQIKIQHNSSEAKKLFEIPFFTSFQQNVSQYDETYDKNTNQSTGIFYLSRRKEN